MDEHDEELRARVKQLSCLVLGGTEDEPDAWKCKIADDLIEPANRGPRYRDSEGLCDVIRLIRNKVLLCHGIAETYIHCNKCTTSL